MTAILTNSFRLKQAELFLDAFENSALKNIYIGIGRPNEWANELNPDVPIDNITNISDCYATLIGLKKLSVSDVVNVVPRFNWETNTKFVPYSNIDENLFLHPTQAELDAADIGGYIAGSFYCMTDSYNVYKCLKAGSSVSTIKPTLTVFTPFETADGYIWKFLFTLSSSLVDKFLTDAWLPVVLLDTDDSSAQWQVQENAVPGSINSVDILAGGSGYSKVFSGTVVSGTSNTVTLSAAPGSTDLTNETVYIASGLGQGQFFKIQTYNTGTKVATIDGTFSVVPNATSTYNIVPTISLIGNGTGFKARPVVSGGTITNVVVQNAGEDYTFGTVVLSSGTGYNLNASVSPLAGHGSNPILELGGSYLMVSSLLEYQVDGNIITDNDYRRLMLITNVQDPDDDISIASTLNALKSITISNIIGTFEQDEIVETSGGSKLFIVSIDVGDNKLYYIQNSETGVTPFTNSETITGLSSGATADIDTLNASQVKPNSGEIIYIKNMRNVMRSPSLIEDIKLLIKF